MRDFRSSSQILFGFLPHQTVDVRGGVWRVEDWEDPITERNVDIVSLRREIVRLLGPWRAAQLDGGMATDIESNRAQVQVISVNKDSGVSLRQFPRIWQCRNSSCRRIFDKANAACPCGDQSRKGQLPFVMYCDRCGELRYPTIPSCSSHGRNIRVVYPGTSTAREIRFECVTCNAVVRQGLGFIKCTCGSNLIPALHRAASVYTPRAVVMVNPPSPEKMRRLREAGGPQRAIEWVVQGMLGALDVSQVSAEGLRRQLLAQGLQSSVVEAMLVAAKNAGQEASEIRVSLSDREAQDHAESEAVTIALALGESRTTIKDLEGRTDPLSELGIIYRDKYPVAFRSLGLESVELLDSFPVLTGHFGYTRGDPNPGQSRVRGFRDRGNIYKIYSDLAETEALFFRLDPVRVAGWIRQIGLPIGQFQDPITARIAILEAGRIPRPGDPSGGGTVGEAVLGLVHSLCHRLIRATAVFAGIDRNALSELLVPSHLGFFVYAAARGDFVLGGLQAVFDGELDSLLHNVRSAEKLCALDPGCSRSGASCAACLHLGEPSCRYFNNHLSRNWLFGERGYLTQPE